jgi:hypothetical protein
VSVSVEITTVLVRVLCVRRSVSVDWVEIPVVVEDTTSVCVNSCVMLVVEAVVPVIVCVGLNSLGTWRIKGRRELTCLFWWMSQRARHM